ncbi:MAG: hypothetical protein ACRDK9_04450 [Solirubrobacterales bacterium]
MIAAALAVALAATATAVAGVTVYENDFSTRAEFREIAKSGGGKRCDRSYRKKSKAMRASVKQGPTTCSFRPPVQGDGELPNHVGRLDGKILKSTANSVRGRAFIEISLRSGGGGVGYSLRVFPEKKRFELIRVPDGGGPGFPAEGRGAKIKPINKRNKLRLTTAGADIVASVNGERVASVTDNDPGQVTGRKVRFGVGSEKDSGKDVAAVFKRVSVGVVPDA